MRRVTLAVCTALCVGLLSACGGDDESDESDKAAAKTAVYFGWLLGTREPAAVAIEVDRADAKGMSKVRAYVCDGRGEPAGMAVWFGGPVDVAATTEPGTNATLTSAGGDEELVLEYVADGPRAGLVHRREGRAPPVRGVPGDRRGRHLRGVPEPGPALQGRLDRRQRARRDGREERAAPPARSRPPTGKKVKFAVQSLALATPARLAARGLPTDYGRYKEVNQVPGEYVAVIAPGGSHWLGRSGNVRGGQSGLNIIGLDKKC